MSLRPIVYSDVPILRKSSHKVRRVTTELQQLVDDMLETMRANNGIGLAAVQVGVLQRVIVVELPVESGDDEEVGPRKSSEIYVVINPKVARHSLQTADGVEGCLSVRGYVGEVSRYSSVTIKGKDLRGKPLRIKAEGLLARVFQHEIDHCDGILFIDRIEDSDKIWPVPEGTEEQVEAEQALTDAESTLMVNI